MPFRSRPALSLAVTGLLVAACTAPDGTPLPKTTEGAVVGGMVGAILGASAGGNKKNNIVIGATIGATAGALIGQELDRQEKALRESIANREVGIVNTGRELVVTLPEAITFDTGSALLRGDLRDDLAALAGNLNEFPDTTIDIVGHTDNVGSAGFNQRLSARRAEAVYEVLLNAGVAPERMRVIGRGESEPKASNLTAEGRAANRRVEIIIRPKG